MQLRVKTLYRSGMSKIINVIWALEIAAAIGLGIATTFSITSTLDLYYTCHLSKKQLADSSHSSWSQIRSHMRSE